MTRRSSQAALSVATLILATMLAMWIAAGIPLRWTKGVVVPDSCARLAIGYACQVELLPDGTRVIARSDAVLIAGRGVELRVWHDLVAGTDNYTVVR